MVTTVFDTDAKARWYAREHITIDPGIVSVHYLRSNAPEREIRLIEVSELLPERASDILEALDFGVDAETGNEHRLLVLDVTPNQWRQIKDGSLSLPAGWSLDNSQTFARNSK